MVKKFFSKTSSIIRFILRRSRFENFLWILSIVVLSVLVAKSYTELFPTKEAMLGMAKTLENPAMVALVGPSIDSSNISIAGMYAHEMVLFVAVTIAIMNILMVSKYTRGDEDEGRLEVLRSLPVGRLTILSSTLIVAFITNFLLSIFIGFSVAITDKANFPLDSSMVFGFSIGGTGFVFATVTAVFAQLCATKRSATTFTFTFLGLAYIIRGITDVSTIELSWINPISWCYLTESYVNDNILPIILMVIFSLILSAIALLLCSIRDLGAGFIPEKKGRSHASKVLLSPIGLALKLQKNIIIAWAIAMFILGATYGSIFGDLDTFFKGNDMMMAMLAAENSSVSLVERTMTLFMTMLTIISTIPILMLSLKLTSEEKSQRIEMIISCEVSRYKLMLSYWIIAFISSIIMPILSALGMYIASTSVMSEPIAFETMFKAGIVYVPAIWLMFSVSIFLIGFLPKFVSLIYLYLGFSFGLSYLGNMLNVPDWLRTLSPFNAIPQIPVDDFNLFPIVVLTIISLVLTFLGFKSYRLRDIN